MNDITPIIDLKSGEWLPHARFSGILFKPVLTRVDNPHANVNTVRVPPGKEIGGHVHAGQVETIFVLAGKSVFTLEGVERPFEAGQIIAVPGGVAHSLRNEGSEMVELLTIFTPPLG